MNNINCCRKYSDVEKDIPEWRIKPEPDTSAQAYWQYLFAKHHQEIASNIGYLPSDIPVGWYKVSPEEALESLKTMLQMD